MDEITFGVFLSVVIQWTKSFTGEHCYCAAPGVRSDKLLKSSGSFSAFLNVLQRRDGHYWDRVECYNAGYEDQ